MNHTEIVDTAIFSLSHDYKRLPVKDDCTKTEYRKFVRQYLTSTLEQNIMELLQDEDDIKAINLGWVHFTSGEKVHFTDDQKSHIEYVSFKFLENF